MNMDKKPFLHWFIRTLALVTLVLLPAAIAQTKSQGKAPMKMRGTTMQQRKQAAANAAIRRAHSKKPHTLATSALSVKSQAIAGPSTLTLDQIYFGTYPNYANSPLPGVQISPTGQVTGWTTGTGIRKFMDALPNIPAANPDTTTFPGSDYYEISLQEYTQKLHTDLPATRLRGYVQTNNGTDASGANTIAPAPIQYLGPLIIAQSGRPVRVKFTNNLPTGAGGNLFIPVDKTVMGAGMGPDMSFYTENRANIHLHGGNTPWISDGTPHQWTVPVGETSAYMKGVSTQNVPDMFFLNGFVVPQCTATVTTNCSGGTAAQLPPGATNDPGQGSMSLYYTNQQSARLMFYHDHAYGITRLDVYAGEAAGYLLTDLQEANMVSSGAIPKLQIPLIIQDKTFVPPNPASAPVYSVPVLANGQNYSPNAAVGFVNGACSPYPTAVPVIGTATNGFGTVYANAIVGITLTNQGNCTAAPDVLISDSTGTGAAAFASLATLAQQDPTWDSSIWGGGGADTLTGNGGLWFPHTYMPNQYPGNPDGSSMNAMGRWDYGMWFWPPMMLSTNGGFDGGLIHGDVPCPIPASPSQTCPGFPNTLLPDMMTKSIASLTPEAFMDTPLVNGAAYPTVTVPAGAVRFRILNAGNDRSLNLSLFTADSSVTTIDGRKNTEVKMVTATPTAGWPIYWPTDGRDGGVPDPATAGPSMIQIGTEGGFLPNPVVIPPTPVGYEYARRSITVTNVSYKSLYLGPAERADVIVDFSAFAGQTLILYNDAPAPTPAFDARYDYYTGDPDMTGMGGAPTTLAGFGPNTRTIMQIVVGAPDPAVPPANLAGLQSALPVAFKASQPAPIIPEAAYSSIYGSSPNTFLKLQDYTATFTPYGATVPVKETLIDKTIQELFELNYGRMNATLGTELPMTNFATQTTIPLGYVDPPTELLADSKNVISQPVGTLGDGTQIWKITHNGVDTHAIHFHLFNVQLINRIGWDGTNRMPDANELGWKETVRMNPLEIDFVALRPVSQNLPWPIPDSIRALDVTMMPEAKDPGMFLLNAAGQPADQTNHITNFGQEYVWHCHLLGHEENDMMRPMVLQVAPGTPSPLAAVANLTGGVDLTFTDNSANEVNFELQRDIDPAFPNPIVIPVPASSPNTSFGLPITYTDLTGAAAQVYYRVRAVADLPGFSTLATQTPEYSGWSNVVPFITAPIAGIAPKTLAFGNQGVGTTSPIQSVTLSNTGTAVLGSIVPTLGDLTNYTVVNNCGASLAPGLTCTLDVAFAPTVTGSLPTTLTVASNDPVNPVLTVGITGTGISSTTTTILAPAIVYGANGVVTVSVASGQAVSGNVTLAVDGAAHTTQALVNGSATFSITAPASGNHALVASFAAQNGLQPSSATGTLIVSQAPLIITASSSTLAYGGLVPAVTPSFATFVLGQTSAVLTTQPTCSTTATSKSAPATYPSTCTGAAAANYSISYVAGTVVISKATTTTTITSNLPNPSIVGQIVTVSVAVAPQYAGTVPTGIVKVTASTGETCSVTLPATSCTMTFTPAGTRTLTAVYAGDANFTGNTATASQSVVGATLSTTSLLFGNQTVGTTSASQTVTFANVGTATLNINSITLAPTTNYTFTTTCGTTLRAGRNCNIQVRFAPKSLGVLTAAISISDSADPVPQVISLTGTGTVALAPVLQVTPLSLAFGSITNRTTSPAKTITVSNTGTGPMQFNGGIFLGGNNSNQFTQTNNCGGTLAAGTSCTVTVRFAPNQKGSKTATLNVNVNAPAVSQQVALTGTSL
jgi:FtsP/CotA-like multicopper oxidase with cupredoxin domain